MKAGATTPFNKPKTLQESFHLLKNKVQEDGLTFKNIAGGIFQALSMMLICAPIWLISKTFFGPISVQIAKAFGQVAYNLVYIPLSLSVSPSLATTLAYSAFISVGVLISALHIKIFLETLSAKSIYISLTTILPLLTFVAALSVNLPGLGILVSAGLSGGLGMVINPLTELIDNPDFRQAFGELMYNAFFGTSKDKELPALTQVGTTPAIEEQPILSTSPLLAEQTLLGPSTAPVIFAPPPMHYQSAQGLLNNGTSNIDPLLPVSSVLSARPLSQAAPLLLHPVVSTESPLSSLSQSAESLSVVASPENDNGLNTAVAAATPVEAPRHKRSADEMAAATHSTLNPETETRGLKRGADAVKDPTYLDATAALTTMDVDGAARSRQTNGEDSKNKLNRTQEGKADVGLERKSAAP